MSTAASIVSVPSALPSLPTLALSVRQPWAWLLANGIKDVENRPWRTRFRGRFLIHAARQPDRAHIARYSHLLNGIALPEHLDAGGIIGVADLVDCVAESDSPWFGGPFGFVLAHACPMPFVPCCGRLGFFSVSDEVLACAQEPLMRFRSTLWTDGNALASDLP